MLLSLYCFLHGFKSWCCLFLHLFSNTHSTQPHPNFTKTTELVHLRAQYETQSQHTRGHGTNQSRSGDSHATSLSTSALTTPTDEISPPSPVLAEVDEDNLWVSPDAKLRTLSEIQIGKDVTEEDLMIMYKETETLEEQGDILHYLAFTKGLSWETRLGNMSSNPKVTVKDLLKDLYEKACQVSLDMIHKTVLRCCFTGT